MENKTHGKNKRKYFYIVSEGIIVLIGIFLFVMLRNNSTGMDVEKIEQVELIILENTVSDMGLTFEIKNMGDKSICFTEDIFTIERKKHGKYKECSVLLSDLTSMATETVVNAGSKIKVTLNWEAKYGHLKGESYRLIIPVEQGDRSFFIAKDFDVY